MANWKALTWSESVRTGKQAARHVLTVLCLKCDDDYRVFSDATRLAGFCELSTRRIYGWLDYLEQHGLVTVIRRVRPNGSEAKPITLLNAPDAPHLNNKPVILDYGGKYLYPREPTELRQAGIQWVSAGDLGRVHPSHPEPAQHDESSGCQDDELAGCATSADNDHSQVGQHDESSSRQHDESSPHGGDDSSPPNQSPPETIPSNQPAEGDSYGHVEGGSGNADWLAGQDSQAEQTPGTTFLRELVLPNGRRLTEEAIRAEGEHADRLLASNWDPQELAEVVLDAAGATVRSWPAFVRGKLRKQQPKAAPTSTGSHRLQSPDGPCGACDARPGDPVSARIVWLDTDKQSWRWCTCHPKGSSETARVRFAA